MYNRAFIFVVDRTLLLWVTLTKAFFFCVEPRIWKVRKGMLVGLELLFREGRSWWPPFWP